MGRSPVFTSAFHFVKVSEIMVSDVLAPHRPAPPHPSDHRAIRLLRYAPLVPVLFGWASLRSAKSPPLFRFGGTSNMSTASHLLLAPAIHLLCYALVSRVHDAQDPCDLPSGPIQYYMVLSSLPPFKMLMF